MSSRKSEAEIRLTQWLWRACLGGIFVWLASLWAAWYFEIDSATALHALTVNIGTAGLTIAVGGVLGGFVRRIFDRIESERAEVKARTEAAKARREDNIVYLRSILDDIKRVYDIVEHARLMIDSHKSARTYGEQVRALPDAIIILHNIKRALAYDTRPAPDLNEPIQLMIRFLKKLTGEFQARYITVSRLQAQDEANNRLLRAEAAKGDRKAPEDVTQMAWDEIRTFPCLRVLRHDCPFIAEDVTTCEVDALRAEAEAGAWFSQSALAAIKTEETAFRLLRRKYEVLFLDHVDAASAALRDNIRAEQAKNVDEVLTAPEGR